MKKIVLVCVVGLMITAQAAEKANENLYLFEQNHWTTFYSGSQEISVDEFLNTDYLADLRRGTKADREDWEALVNAHKVFSPLEEIDDSDNILASKAGK